MVQSACGDQSQDRSNLIFLQKQFGTRGAPKKFISETGPRKVPGLTPAERGAFFTLGTL
jgi:hypothetical protein